jgi:hypothetical protein
VLDEIDDAVRATLGSITVATMQKVVERHQFTEAKPNTRRRRRAHG